VFFDPLVPQRRRRKIVIILEFVQGLVKIRVFRPSGLAPFKAANAVVLVEFVIVVPVAPGVFPAFAVFAFLPILFVIYVLQIVKHTWSFPSLLMEAGPRALPAWSIIRVLLFGGNPGFDDSDSAMGFHPIPPG
jgi:hypothetical protein